MRNSLLSFIFIAACLVTPQDLLAVTDLLSLELIAEGKELLNHEKYPAAAEKFKAALEANPESMGAKDYLARTYLAANEMSAAKDILQPLVNAHVQESELYATLTLYYKKKGNWLEGLASAKKAIAMSPQSVRANLNYGMLLYDQGLTEDAIVSLKRALTLGGTGVEIFLYLALCYGELGDEYLEIDFYKEALKVKPKQIQALFGLGRAYEKNEDFDAAKDIYEEITRQDPLNPEGYYRLGRIAEKTEDFKKARKYYVDSIDRGDLVEAHKALAPLVLYDKRHQELALKVFEKLTMLEPLEPEHPAQLGYLYQVRKEYDKARESYRSALKLDPSVSVNYYNLGVIAQQEKKWDAANDLFEQAIELHAEDGDYFVSQSTVLCQLGRSEAAWQSYERGRVMMDDYRAKDLLRYLEKTCERG